MTFRHISDVCRAVYEQNGGTWEDQNHDHGLQEMRADVQRLAKLLKEGKRSHHGDVVITLLQDLWATIDYKADPESYINAINQAIWLMLQLRGCLEKQSEKSEAL
jgi:hypothetical protein